MTDQFDYDASVARIIELVRLEKGTPDLIRKEKSQLTKLAKVLTAATEELEAYPHPAILASSHEVKRTLASMREIAEAAKKEVEEIPSSRQQTAARYAASALCYLRHYCRMSLPSTTLDGEGVNELREICNAAGIYISDSGLQKYLAEARKEFDPKVTQIHSVENFLIPKSPLEQS